MALEFTPESEAKVKEFEETYYNKMACLLPTLWVAQDQFGYLPPEALDLVAERLELPRMHVESVASFYHLYKREKVGRHHIQICRTLSCAMYGSMTPARTPGGEIRPETGQSDSRRKVQPRNRRMSGALRDASSHVDQ